VTVGFLAEIVSETRAAIARGQYELPEGSSPPPADRASFREAVRSSSPGALVVEFKRVSPGSLSPTLPERSPAEFEERTRAAGVAAYSCLATPPRFAGSARDVAELARATRRPVLFKDFVVEVAQVEAAARAGASAILLIARLADTGLLTTPLPALADAAHRRGLEVLLEFHDRSELRQAADVSADVYGVNVRDLETLRMEPDHAMLTLRAAAALRPLLGLSGVASPEDARRFWSAGADGILVGSSVAWAKDPVSFLASLRPVNGRPSE
jgi:indole-3-glycerol phosphate synthase